MSETYERGPVKLVLADCLEWLPTLEAGSVDAVVTSPPYNQKLDQFKASGFKAEGNAAWADRAASSYFDSLPENEYQERQVEILNAMHSVSASDASVFYNHKCRWRDKILIHPLDFFRRSRWRLRQEIIWARDGSLTQNAKMFPPSEERVIWGFKNSWKWNEDSNRYMSVWRINSEHNSIHPVAFPIEIPTRCIEAATFHEDTVCDPFTGSGTTAIACIRTGRRFIGCEIERKYFDIACARIDRELDQGRLFDAPKAAKETQRELI